MRPRSPALEQRSGLPPAICPGSAVEKPVLTRHAWAVSARQIRLFIKPYCPWCHRAMRWLDDRGIRYQSVDVIADETAFDEMRRLSGQELAPVIDVEGRILADFGPEQLAAFWSKLNREALNR